MYAAGVAQSEDCSVNETADEPTMTDIQPTTSAENTSIMLIYYYCVDRWHQSLTGWVSDYNNQKVVGSTPSWGTAV